MKSGTSFFQFPFVIISREKYQELIIAESNRKELEIKVSNLERELSYMTADCDDTEKSRNFWMKETTKVTAELAKINLKRNAKGQFERRSK